MIRLECMDGGELWIEPQHITGTVVRYWDGFRLVVYVDSEYVNEYPLETEYATHQEAIEARDEFTATVNAALKSPA